MTTIEIKYTHYVCFAKTILIAEGKNGPVNTAAIPSYWFIRGYFFGIHT